MKRAALTLFTLLALAGCPYRIPDGRLVCTESDDCPPGFVCNTVGTCDRGEVDAAIADAGTTDAPTCAVDDDDDGACADVDCDDGDGAVYPGAVEACTSSTEGVAPRDDDCDGTIDEGCAYHVGEPHWVTDVLATSGAILAPHLSADGLRLYACASNLAGEQVPEVATRTSTDARFGRFVPVPGIWDEGTGSLQPVDAFAMGPDRLEALVVVKATTPRVSLYRRAGESGGFAFHALIGEDLVSPSFSPDGLEMIAVSDGSVVLGARTALGADFDASAVILPAGGSQRFVSAAFIGEDALVVLVVDGAATATEVRIARRSDSSFALTDEVLPLEGAYGSVAYHPANRELFFTSSRDWTSLRPPTEGLWRAEVCRDGECPARLVTCSTDDGERRSADGTHCYAVNENIRGWSQMSSLCGGSRDAHLASLHSAAEQDLVAMLAEDLYWIGGDITPSNTWDSGEAWTTDFYGTGWPMGPGDCVQFSSAANEMRNGICDDPFRGICETELWPVW